MDGILLVVVAASLLAIILIVITIVIIKSNQKKKYRKEIENLDIEKNSLLGVPVLSEISKVKELVKTDKKSVTYEIISEKGPSHDKTFVCQVLVDGIVLGKGSGSSKKQAEQEAAKVALSKQAK